MKGLSVLFYIVSTIFTGIGLHKMYVYESAEYSFADSVNAYVGGDAYNYIINSGFATAYFVLATMFVILGSFVLILDKLNQKESLYETQNDKVVENSK